jgi:transcription-repair coupling factor (superfamily II helicase)
MSAQSDLGASLQERGLSAAKFFADREEAEDPLPPLRLVDGDSVRFAAIGQRALAPSRVFYRDGFGAAAPALIARLAQSRQVLVICADQDEARRLAEDAQFFLGSARRTQVLAASDASPYAEIAPDRRGQLARLGVLAELASAGPPAVVVTCAVGAVRKLIPPSSMHRTIVTVERDAELDRDGLAAQLVELGYLRVPLVEDPGSFAVRGALVDVWPPGRDKPLRIELYGDMVLSLRNFEAEDQKTIGADLGRVALGPARDAQLGGAVAAYTRQALTDLCDACDLPTSKARALIDDVLAGRSFFGAEGFLPAHYPQLATIFDYLQPECTVVVVEPESTLAALRTEFALLERDFAARKPPAYAPDRLALGEAELALRLAPMQVACIARTVTLGGEDAGLGWLVRGEQALKLGTLDHDDLMRATKAARAQKGHGSALRPLVRRVEQFVSAGLAVCIVARTEVQAERLHGLLRPHLPTIQLNLHAFAQHALLSGEPLRSPIQLVLGNLSRGGVFPADGIALITEEEILGARIRKARQRGAAGKAAAFLEDLRALKVGDYVVHVDHGIGRYAGLMHREVAGLKVELLAVEYGGGDKLYLPVYRLNQIQKYSGGEHAEPRLDKLGGQTFAKAKGKVRKAVREMADVLLRLYAEREAQVAEPLPPRGEDYAAFEATFPFEETADQAKAIAEVDGDFDRGRPMDRLVCGDVGFGKTEVALRAAFRMALAGKQVAVLCPTTVLAQQHFRVFEARMQNYPINLRVMSRFETKSECDATLKSLKMGSCDIVIGTHRLLSKDVHFKQLGLLVVDEEQRFGVTHKERIKQLKAQVHVLTLSATPIPRTLQMAVTGLRDLSLITTPPADRRAVRTIVSRWDAQVLREAIERELGRGGQIFYVYNRIEGIYERAQRLQELVPHARIAVGHGQMTKASGAGESALERTMLDFVEGRYDILVATAIVESGLDIPRANTILIDRADLFGLSQLYQLRGRVGRSKERAYCYLIVPPVEAMSEEARARIEALERHTELGSGFKIASLDLELRGAGDLLGGEQSGNVASVGFELFCQLLDEASAELRGEPVLHEVDTELSYDISALLPEDYIGDIGLRLSLYKRLASAIDESQVQELGIEMENRFGPPPTEAKCLLQMMAQKTELRRLRVLGCEASATRVTLHLRADTALDPAKISELVRPKSSPYKLSPDMRLTRRIEGAAHGIDACELVLQELAACVKLAS